MKKKTTRDPFLPRHAQAQPGAEVRMTADEQGDVTVSFSDGSSDLKVSRREFMRISSVAAATAAMSQAACRNPIETIVPYVDRPEEVRIGNFSTYATVWNNTGILVRTRAGRPVKLEGNPSHPTSQGALSAQGQSAYMSLYDPDRAKMPLSVSGETPQKTSWQTLDQAVINRLLDLKTNARVAILTPTLPGGATKAMIDEVLEALPNAKHYTWDAVNNEAMLVANQASYGRRALPHYRFDKADRIVSLQSDFLGTWLSPVEFTKQFASRRDPAAPQGMNRLIAFEGIFTLTGARADWRYRVRPSDLVFVALGLAHEITQVLRQGPLAGDGALAGALGPFGAETMEKQLGLEAGAIKLTAADLAGHVNRSLVVAGGVASSTQNGVSLEAAVNLLNAALGADGNTIERQLSTNQSSGNLSDLVALTKAINDGGVEVLIVGEVNPVYSAPPQVKFKEALASRKVPLVISCEDRITETSVYANYLATASNFLESWGDAVPFEGVYSLQQPVVRPLYDTRSFGESMVTWFAGANLVPRWKEFLKPAAVPVGQYPGQTSFETGSWYRYLRNHWLTTIYPQANTLTSFDAFWEALLRTGVWEAPRPAGSPAARFDTAATVGLLEKNLKSVPASGKLENKEIVLFESIPMGDGTYANNAHLQELPDPITKSTWTSYVMVSPKTFREAGLENGELLSLRPSGAEKAFSLEFPVIMVPGLHDDVVGVPLGYGRTRCGEVGEGIGSNAFLFSSVAGRGNQILAGFRVEISKTGNSEELAIPQGSQVIDLTRRGVLAVTTLEEFKKDDRAGIHDHPALEDFWPEHKYPVKWGMAIDLSRCTGCNACVIACQEENNTPVVGRSGVAEGREMHWMRIDRYYKLPENEELEQQRLSPISDPMFHAEPYVAMSQYIEEPRVLFQPMLCQHCENAPCETVCPVLATIHSSDGLNQMAYNRCVGTRYCANNCPFKVRRFNWYNYSEDRSQTFFATLYPELVEHARYNNREPLHHALNPEVIVRARGVMEKCTFCVQRIRRAKWQVKSEKRSFRDGDVVTACQQTCPADAIVFGDLANPNSAVSKMHVIQRTSQNKVGSKRALSPLSEIGVASSVAYLTNVVNAEKVDRMSNMSVHHGAGGMHVAAPEDEGGHGGAH